MPENAMQGVLNGYIVLGKNTRIQVEEVQINLSRDLTRRYNTGIVQAAGIVPGQERIEFTIKRVFSNATLHRIYKARCMFSMVLFNNSTNPGLSTDGDKILTLTGCILGSDNIGPLNGSDFMTEDVSGEALDILVEDKEVAEIVNSTCTNL